MTKLFEQRFPYGDTNRPEDPHYYLRVSDGKVKIGKQRCPVLCLAHYFYDPSAEVERQMKMGVDPVYANAWDTLNKALPNRWAVDNDSKFYRLGDGDTWMGRVSLVDDEICWRLFFSPQGTISFARLMFLKYTPLTDFDPQGIEAALETWRQEIVDSDARGMSSLLDNPPGWFTRTEWGRTGLELAKFTARPLKFLSPRP